MLETGPALKVTIHLNRDTGAANGFLVDEIFAFLRHHGIEGATAMQAWAGYGAHRRLHTTGAADIDGAHLPMMIYFIEAPAKAEAILDELISLVTDGLVEAHPTQILKNASSPVKVIS